MKTKNSTLTRRELDVLILCAIYPRGKHLSNYEIAQRLGTSVSKVKTLLHQACIKLGAHNRIEAPLFAVRRKYLSLNDVYSIDELAEVLGAVGPDMLREIASLVRQDLEHGRLPGGNKMIICEDRSQTPVLTNREREVLILAGRGLSNKEIGNRLCIATSSVRIFLHRVCTKLGTHNRADAVALAIKQKEIIATEIYPLKDLVKALAPLGAEYIERMAQMLTKERPVELFLPGYYQ